VFIVASPADADRVGHERRGRARYGRPGPADGDSGPVALLPTPTAKPENANDLEKRKARQERSREKHGRPFGESLSSVIAAQRLLPTPRASEADHPGRRSTKHGGQTGLAEAVNLLSTPTVDDMGAGKTVEAWDEWTAAMQAKHGNGKSLAIEAQRLLPMPRAQERMQRNSRDDYVALSAVTQWGEYAAAIARWERLTRPAPAPTEPTGKNGAHRLSPRFTEWMMGAPDGWITDVPGLTRNEALKACGNGVVSQQAVAALEWLLEATS
jgi:DNA (cytosine-5)-methyltransferase 1